MGIDVISWDTIIGKKVKSSDKNDLGKVHTITKDFVQTKEGLVSKNYYFIPKYYVQGYDGEDVWVSLTKDEIKAKFERDNAPTDLKGFLPSGYDEKQAATIKEFPEFENQVPTYSPVGKSPEAATSSQEDKLVMPWEDVIGKKVKSIDEHEIGEIKSVFSAFVEVEDGMLRKDRYYIPKYYIEGYDNDNHVITSLTKEDIKEKYKRDGPPLESELDTQEYLQRKQAKDERHPQVFVNGIPFMAKEPGVLLESKRTGEPLNIPWEEVIFKRVKTSDEVDIGDIETVANEYIVVREGVGKIRRYYLPKSQITNYDGSALYVDVPGDLVSAKFERDSPPTPEEVKALTEERTNVTQRHT
ncbi:MAG: hypothetical protein ACRD8Z_16630 [Nitrososphaeraceae archaeon]